MKGVKLVLILGLVMLLAVAFVVSSCKPAPTVEEPIKVGWLGKVDHTRGIAEKYAAKMAVDEVNAAGGILGRPVELCIVDSKLTAEGAVTAVHKLVEVDKVHFLTGGLGSETTVAAREAAMDAKKIFIAVGSATHDNISVVVEEPGRYKYFFRISPPDELDDEAHYVVFDELPWLKAQMEEKLGHEVNKVAVLTDAAMWQDLCHPYFLEEIPKQGFEIVWEGRLSTSAKDCSVELSGIKKSGAQIIVTGTAYGSTLPLVRQWGEMEVPAMWSGANVLAMTPGFWERTEGKCVYSSTYNLGGTDAPINKITQEFYAKVEPEVGCYYDTHGPYVAVWAYKHACEKAGTTETEAVVKALEEIRFETVGGVLDFKANHTVLWAPDNMILFTVQHQPGGKLVVIHPEDIATGELMLPPWIK